MICLHCGKELSDSEKFCSDCGNPVENTDLNNSVEKPVLISSSDVEYSEQVNENTSVISQDNVVKNNHNKSKLIIFFVVFLMIILFVIGYFLLNSNSKNNGLNNKNIVATNTSSMDNKVEFLGYTFNVPDGFKTSEEAGKLFFESDSVVYFISFDFTNSIDIYKKELSLRFPEQESLLSQNLYGRDYLVLVMHDTESDLELCQFVTNGNGNDVIVGQFVNSSKDVDTTDFDVLTDIIDSSKSISSSFANTDNSVVDVGKNGIKIYDSKEINNEEFRIIYDNKVE